MSNEQYLKIKYYERLMKWTTFKAYCSFCPDKWAEIEGALFNRYFQ